MGGDLRYGDERPVLAPGARVVGKISNEDWADTASGWGWVSAFAWWLAVSVSTLIVGVLLVWLAPGALSAAARAVGERLGATIGWGVAIAIGAPLLAILALVTLVGIPFGIGLLLAAIPVLLVAYTTSAWVVGRRVVGDRSRRMGGAAGRLGDPAAAGPHSGRRRARRAGGDGGRTGSADRRALARPHPERGLRRQLRAVPQSPPDDGRCVGPVRDSPAGVSV